MSRPLLTSLRDRISYYEWAYGRLAEQDSDIGPVGEFLVGKLLGILPPVRRVNARYDLALPDGRGIEVKTTTHKRQVYGEANRLDYRWNVTTQMRNPTDLAPIWIFLVTDFPAEASSKPRFDVFNPIYWTARLSTGPAIATLKVKRTVTGTALNRLGSEPFPLSQLKSSISKL